jgi:hypothetical protein
LSLVYSTDILEYILEIFDLRTCINMCVHLDYNQGKQHQLQSLPIHPPLLSIFYLLVLIIIPCQYPLDLLASLLYDLSMIDLPHPIFVSLLVVY